MAIGFFWTSIALGVFLSILFFDVMGLFSNKNHFPVDGRTAIVTGGSQGMGKGVAKLLAKKGANIVIVARDVKKLQDALEAVKAAAARKDQRFHFISADLTIAQESQRVIEETTTWNHGQPPDIVWAVAGSAKPMLFVDTPVEMFQSQMNTNYFSAAYLAHATLRRWLAPMKPEMGAKDQSKPARHLIMTSSVAAFLPMGGYTPYSPSKAALRSLADDLHSEMQYYNGAMKSSGSKPETKVEIHCVFPGTILSPGLEEENKSKHAITHILEDGDIQQTEDEVAAAAVKGLQKGHFLVSTQFLGEVLRVSGLQGSPRNSSIVDTLLSFVASLAWLYIGPDMDKKLRKYGTKNGIGAEKAGS